MSPVTVCWCCAGAHGERIRVRARFDLHRVSYGEGVRAFPCAAVRASRHARPGLAGGGTVVCGDGAASDLGRARVHIPDPAGGGGGLVGAAGRWDWRLLRGAGGVTRPVAGWRAGALEAIEAAIAVGRAVFAAEHGREAADAQELSGFIARASRVGSKAVAGVRSDVLAGEQRVRVVGVGPAAAGARDRGGAPGGGRAHPRVAGGAGGVHPAGPQRGAAGGGARAGRGGVHAPHLTGRDLQTHMWRCRARCKPWTAGGGCRTGGCRTRPGLRLAFEPSRPIGPAEAIRIDLPARAVRALPFVVAARSVDRAARQRLIDSGSAEIRADKQHVVAASVRAVSFAAAHCERIADRDLGMPEEKYLASRVSPCSCRRR